MTDAAPDFAHVDFDEMFAALCSEVGFCLHEKGQKKVIAALPKGLDAAMKAVLAAEGVDCLPLILFDGRIVNRRGYPSRELLGMWAVEHEPESTEEFQQNFRHALLEQFEERLSHAHDDHDRTEITDD